MEDNEERKAFEHLHRIADNTFSGRYLYTHPFGLQIPFPSSMEYTGSPILCGHPDDPVSSLRNMVTAIAKQIRLSDGAFPEERAYFRVIAVQLTQGPKKVYHKFFFECGLNLMVFICGGCDDKTEAGKEEGSDLMAIFGFLSNLYRAEIKEIRIQYEVGRRHLEALMEAADFEGL